MVLSDSPSLKQRCEMCCLAARIKKHCLTRIHTNGKSTYRNHEISNYHKPTNTEYDHFLNTLGTHRQL